MNVVVNGDPQDVDDGVTLAAIVDAAAPSRRGVAVAVNGDVVRRVDWEQRALCEGDRVEVLAAQQGG